MSEEPLALDIFVSEDRPTDAINEIIQNVRPDWKTEDIKLKVFTDGITNKLVGCYLGEFKTAEVILVRIYGQKTELIIDRDDEKRNMMLLKEQESAKTLHATFKNGIVYGFIHGTIPNADTVREEPYASKIAEEMARYHALKAKDADPDRDSTPSLFHKMRTYHSLMPSEFPDADKTKRLHELIPSQAEMLVEIELMEEAVNSLGELEIVFSHNDILINNIVYNKNDDRVYFIDYEYGSYNYYGYDIGSHFCEWAGVDEVDYNRYPDKETQYKWLRSYLKAKYRIEGINGIVTEEKIEKLYKIVNIFGLCSHLFWGFWALIQSTHSTLDFDFLAYGAVRFNEYFKQRKHFISLIKEK